MKYSNYPSKKNLSSSHFSFSSEIDDPKKLPKVIIDTDAGGDDAMALMLAIRTEKIDIVAITCSYGNTDLKNVEANVLKVLTVANRTDVRRSMLAR